VGLGEMKNASRGKHRALSDRVLLHFNVGNANYQVKPRLFAKYFPCRRHKNRV